MGRGVNRSGQPEPRVKLSLLDRLFDDHPESREDVRLTPRQSRQRHHDSIRRSLSDLLNSRRRDDEAPPEYRQCSNSLLNYGLPDFTTLNLRGPHDQDRLRAAIEEAITRFEPRLTMVSVTFETPEGDEYGHAAYRITALARMEPEPEPVTFETVLKSEAGFFEVVEGSS
jgi:type VI secretion system protein ImpF